MPAAPWPLTLLWLEPVVPFASACLLLLWGRRWGRRAAAWLGTGAIAAAFVVAALVAWGWAQAPPAAGGWLQVLWTWFTVGDFHPRVALYLDPLALVMTLAVSFVSFLIHWYSVEHMRESEGYERFFGYMNLFVASMLTLVLADNLLLLLLGWEGVGLCSYLLIGFWYGDEANGLAGRKAFIVTRVGDTAFLLGLLLLFQRLGTLDIQPLLQRATAQWHPGAAVAEAACLLLLGGAVGKSAQLPLQTWLPDAMAGPTPTSALIHAATMVTAGVYLIARLHPLYQLAPIALAAVALIGWITLLMAGCSALVQNDIKRILAYSTISQIGYMFLALGVGAWSAAIFHLVTHAFFKALLFLGAGAVIHAMHEEHNIFRMGGLRRQMPLTFWCFLIAGASLAGLPLVTAGFYSKGMIIWFAWSSPRGSAMLGAGALVGAFLTALYIFRLIFVVFYGPAAPPVTSRPGVAMRVPMLVLAFLSLTAGVLDLPAAMGGRAWLSRFLAPVLPPLLRQRASRLGELGAEEIAAAVFFVGVFLVYLLWMQRRALLEAMSAQPALSGLRRFWHSDWGMDWLYDRLFVHPVVALARADRDDIVDAAFSGLAAAAIWCNRQLSRSEGGLLRRYAAWVAVGAILLAAMVVLR